MTTSSEKEAKGPDPQNAGEDKKNIPSLVRIFGVHSGNLNEKESEQRLKGFEALEEVSKQLLSEDSTYRDWHFIAENIKPLTPVNYEDIMTIMKANNIEGREISNWMTHTLPMLLTAWGLGATSDNPTEEIKISYESSNAKRRAKRILALKEICIPSRIYEEDITKWWIRHRNHVIARGLESSQPGNQSENTTKADLSQHTSQTKTPDIPTIKDDACPNQQSNPKHSNQSPQTRAKQRKGNLPDIGFHDITKNNLSPRQVVEDWLQNPEGKGTEFKEEAMIALSNAASRAYKERNEINKALTRPIRVTKTEGSRWHRYALITHRTGSLGNLYGIIDDQKNKLQPIDE